MRRETPLETIPSNDWVSFVWTVLVVGVVGAAFAFVLPDCRGVRSSFAVDDDGELLAAAKKEEEEISRRCEKWMLTNHSS